MDALLEKFQTAKGPQSGAAPLSTEFMDITTAGLNLRNELNQAVEDERLCIGMSIWITFDGRYDDAARIRDEILKLNARAEASAEQGGPSPASVEFRLGQIVKHKSLDYQLVCGS